MANPFSSVSGKNPKELRSFRFFIHMTASTLGQAFSTTFWKDEIPRAGHHDDGIWHAIISLASAHESSASAVLDGPAGSGDLYTLMHYNLAIQDLMKSYSHAPDGWWRALTLSVLFTSICCLEGKYPEARMHFKSGYKLICEFDTDPSTSKNSRAKRSSNRSR